MDIVRRKNTQQTVYDIENFGGAKDLLPLVKWLQDHDRETPLYLNYGAMWSAIHNRDEAMAFARGLEMAVRMLESERPAVSYWSDYDDTCFVVLAFSRDHTKALAKLGDQFLRELFLVKWVEHIDHIKTEDGRLLIRRDVWDTLSLNQQRSLLDRAQGFIEALDA